MTFDYLIKESAHNQELPSGFLENVQKRIALRKQQQRRQSLLLDTLCLSGALIFFFYSLSLLLVNVYAFETLDFLLLVLTEPSLLSLEEGRIAVIDSLPLTSILLTAISIAICFFLLRRLITDMTPYLSIPFHRHAFS